MFREKNEFCFKKLAVLNQIKLIKPKQTDTWLNHSNLLLIAKPILLLLRFHFKYISLLRKWLYETSLVTRTLCGFSFFFFFVGSSVIIFHLSQFLDYVIKKKKFLILFSIFRLTMSKMFETLGLEWCFSKI